MAIRKVARMGHPVLRKIAAPVPEKAIKTPEFQGFVHDLIDTMFEYDGRGLAAPQIHESLRVVVMLWKSEKSSSKPTILCLINPVIKPLTSETSHYWEGCLSLPGLRGLVERPNRIAVTALGLKGEKIEMEVDGFDATVVQHECDHLDGVLYIDRIKDLKNFSFNQEYDRHLSNPDDPDDEGDNE
ncbi:MAG: peptide deformylase [Deltaproteobacteria bacterium]|nr:peptide deformylase [Deltaproteobacteria bacterium]